MRIQGRTGYVFVHTENSVYEFDLPNFKVRRTEGNGAPTPRFGEDGEWRVYIEVSEIAVGETILIRWPDGQPELRDFSVTSLVIAIEEPWPYDESKTSNT